MTNPMSELYELVPQIYCPSACDGHGTYAEADEDGDATPAQCQYCYEVRLPLIAAIQSLIQKARLEGQIDVLIETYNKNFIHWGDDLEQAKFDISKRISELKAALAERGATTNGTT